MSATVDANVLVYASDEEADEHDRAKALVIGLLQGPSLTTLFWPVLLSVSRSGATTCRMPPSLR